MCANEIIELDSILTILFDGKMAFILRNTFYLTRHDLSVNRLYASGPDPRKSIFIKPGPSMTFQVELGSWRYTIKYNIYDNHKYYGPHFQEYGSSESLGLIFAITYCLHGTPLANETWWFECVGKRSPWALDRGGFCSFVVYRNNAYGKLSYGMQICLFNSNIHLTTYNEYGGRSSFRMAYEPYSVER